MFLIYSEMLKIDFQRRKWNHSNRRWIYFSSFQASAKKSSFNMSLICFKELKIDIQNRKQSHQNRKWNYFSTSRVMIKNLLVQNVFICSMVCKIDFQNRKWNYFSYFQASDKKKTSFTKYLSFVLRCSILIFKTGIGIIQTGIWIISSSFRALIKNLLLHNISNCSKAFKIDFQNM